MLEAILESPALWGLLGALFYALPRLVAGAYAAEARGAPWARCILEFLIALFGGVVFAVALTPWAVEYAARTFGREAEGHDLWASAFLIGMVANPAAPRLVEWLGDRVGGGRRGKA